MKLIQGSKLEKITAYQKVMYWFFDYPRKEIGLNELTQELNISKTTANRIVSELVNEGFLNLKKISNLWRITCNYDHHYNISRKIPYHLQLVYESKIIDSILAEYTNPKSIILFGSYRKGDDISTSDIDIAIESNSQKKIEIIEFGEIAKLGFRKNVKVSLHVFSKKKTDINLLTNIANGIILDGLFEIE